MRYFIDTEFDGYRGPLISMALVREDGRSLYFIMEGAEEAATDRWVIENVLPILRDCPEPPHLLNSDAAAFMIGLFLMDDLAIEVVADWPDDIKHLCDLLHYAPGNMVPGPQQAVKFTIARVDAYPTQLPSAVQHNAWWDATALREKVEADEEAQALADFSGRGDN